MARDARSGSARPHRSAVPRRVSQRLDLFRGTREQRAPPPSQTAGALGRSGGHGALSTALSGHQRAAAKTSLRASRYADPQAPALTLSTPVALGVSTENGWLDPWERPPMAVREFADELGRTWRV